ncbi:stage III sporulation protein AG [Barrientosiimonas marina]|uniref:Stage III sporulation protein AG n=1 Tax=Lentibacillus kimchii TaxID=1542911 RepID=A0ABW2UYS2_9BACI
MKQFLQKWLQTSDSTDKPPKKFNYILIIGLIGLLLLIIGNVFSSSDEAQETPMDDVQEETDKQPADETLSDKAADSPEMDEVEKSYEEDLQHMLNQIEGVSETEVMVNLDSTSVKVFEKNLINGQQVTEETDENGGTRDIEDTQKETEVVLINRGDKEVPLLVRTEKPDVRGVFIVAKGVDHATVEKWVVDAISSVLDVATHKVSVMPK